MINRKTIAMRRTALLWAAAAITLGAATTHSQIAKSQNVQTRDVQDIPAFKRNAAKLAGLVGFVNLYCDKLRTDQDRFKGAIQAMGTDPAELDRDALLLEARTYLVAYQKDVPGNCQKADELFGRGGKIISGVFLSR